MSCLKNFNLLSQSHYMWNESVALSRETKIIHSDVAMKKDQDQISSFAAIVGSISGFLINAEDQARALARTMKWVAAEKMATRRISSITGRDPPTLQFLRILEALFNRMPDGGLFGDRGLIT